MNGKKTYFTIIAAFLAVWVTYFAGGGETVTLKEAVYTSFTAAIAAFGRHAITTNGVKALTTKPPVLLLCALPLLGGSLTSCEGLRASPFTVGYELPRDGGKVEVTLFPDRLFNPRTGKAVVPAK